MPQAILITGNITNDNSNWIVVVYLRITAGSVTLNIILAILMLKKLHLRQSCSLIFNLVQLVIKIFKIIK